MLAELRQPWQECKFSVGMKNLGEGALPEQIAIRPEEHLRWYRFQGQVSLLFWAVVELLELSRCEIVESRVSSFEDVVSDVVGHLTDCCLST